mmetsp:Transcript_96153/g.175963  ORF Transcript_96153/g.175963 Transcript_96153/m.175963 type:complete len:218 (+) Transcript_96153:70-723(+)
MSVLNSAEHYINVETVGISKNSDKLIIPGLVARGFDNGLEAQQGDLLSPSERFFSDGTAYANATARGLLQPLGRNARGDCVCGLGRQCHDNTACAADDYATKHATANAATECCADLDAIPRRAGDWCSSASEPREPCNDDTQHDLHAQCSSSGDDTGNQRAHACRCCAGAGKCFKSRVWRNSGRRPQMPLGRLCGLVLPQGPQACVILFCALVQKRP